MKEARTPLIRSDDRAGTRPCAGRGVELVGREFAASFAVGELAAIEL